MFGREKKVLREENARLQSENYRLRAENTHFQEDGRQIKKQLFQCWEVLYGTEKETAKLKNRAEHYRKKANTLKYENQRLTENFRNMSEVARETIRKSKRSRKSKKSRQVSINDDAEVHYVNKFPKSILKNFADVSSVLDLDSTEETDD